MIQRYPPTALTSPAPRRHTPRGPGNDRRRPNLEREEPMPRHDGDSVDVSVYVTRLYDARGLGAAANIVFHRTCRVVPPIGREINTTPAVRAEGG
ncbi:hypothetical protein MTO96_006266 [Rhipicephalus appendiculatus]